MSLRKKLSATLLAATALLSPLLAKPAKAADPGVLHIYNWTDYTAPDLIKKFTQETGIKVTLDTYDSNETLLAKLKAGGSGYDLVIVSNDFVPIFVKQKLIQPIDAASMANFRKSRPEMADAHLGPEGGIYRALAMGHDLFRI